MATDRGLRRRFPPPSGVLLLLLSLLILTASVRQTNASRIWSCLDGFKLAGPPRSVGGSTPRKLFPSLSSLNASLSDRPVDRSVLSSAKPRNAAVTGNRQDSISPPPGPTCAGQCCSNNPPKLDAGAPFTWSVWLSTQMAHGAQVQIITNTWGTWWGALQAGNWGGLITAANHTTPPPSEYFTVIRVGNTQVQFLTPGNTLVRAGGRFPSLLPTTNLATDTTTNSSDPATVFTIEPATQYGADVIFIKAFDGLYLTSEGSMLLRWSTQPKEWERWKAREVMKIPAIRGVNLGSWLVYERWMDKSHYPNPNPLKDGSMISLLSVATGSYVTATGGGGTDIKCNAKQRTFFESFRLQTTQPNSTTYQIRVQLLQYWTLRSRAKLVTATQTVNPGPLDTSSSFSFVFHPTNSSLLLILAPNGAYLRATPDGQLLADFPASKVASSRQAVWTSPAAFALSVLVSNDGEWQLYNYLGPSASSATASSFWSSWITEADWQFMAAQKVNAVRIPIGYWISLDSTPESPFVTGGAAFLDWAFQMAGKYGVRIWISMHGVPGSQSGSSNTGSRSGLIEWNVGDNLKRTLGVLDWLGQRYGSNPNWMGIGLANEPVVEGITGTLGVPIDFLKDYFTQAYALIRGYSPCVFVSMEGRVGSSAWECHWLMFDWTSPNLILETHIYDVFDGGLANVGADAEIQHMQSGTLGGILDIQQFGRPLLVGEFCNAMANPDVSKQPAFSLAQMQTMSAAKMGWFFWSLKVNIDGEKYWSFYQSSALGLLPKKSDGNWY